MYVCVAGNGEMLVNVGEMCKGKTNTCYFFLSFYSLHLSLT